MNRGTRPSVASMSRSTASLVIELLQELRVLRAAGPRPPSRAHLLAVDAAAERSVTPPRAPANDPNERSSAHAARSRTRRAGSSSRTGGALSVTPGCIAALAPLRQAGDAVSVGTAMIEATTVAGCARVLEPKTKKHRR